MSVSVFCCSGVAVYGFVASEGSVSSLQAACESVCVSLPFLL